MSIKIVNGAFQDLDDGNIVLRGVLTPESLGKLCIGAYQREKLSDARIEAIITGLEGKRPPDVELAQRSNDFTPVDGEPGAFVLPGPIYNVDGQQRVAAAIGLNAQGKKCPVGAVVNFGTTDKWERERFRVLNQLRLRVSPNVLLRSEACAQPVMRALKELTDDSSFAMYGKVCWNQMMKRSELTTALTYFETVAQLHSRFGPGKSGAKGAMQPGKSTLSNSLTGQSAKVGKQIMCDNVVVFYGLMEEWWGVKTLVYRQSATHMKGAFMLTLARVLSDHNNFWKGPRLSVPNVLKKKIGTLPLHDTQVLAIASSQGRAAKMLLYPLIVNHLNAGRGTHKLLPLNAAGVPKSVSRKSKRVVRVGDRRETQIAV